MNKICLGCGIVLQNKDKNQNGFVQNLDYEYCERCFRTKNYSEYKEAELNYNNEDILKIINDESKFTIFVTDFISLNKEVVETYKKINTSKIFVLNKSDILPKGIKNEKINTFIEDEYQICEDIIILSSLKKKNISVLKNIILSKENIYFAGFTNSGKSSLLKSIINTFSDKKTDIMASLMPNTTLEFSKIKFNNINIYDSPGFNYNKVIYDNNLKLIKKINTKEIIKPKTYQIKENDTINIEDEIFLNFDKKNNITMYMSNSLKISKYYEKAEMKEYLNVKDNTDLIIKGLGFINVKNSCTLSTNIPLSMLEKRNSIFKD